MLKEVRLDLLGKRISYNDTEEGRKRDCRELNIFFWMSGSGYSHVINTCLRRKLIFCIIVIFKLAREESKARKVVEVWWPQQPFIEKNWFCPKMKHISLIFYLYTTLNWLIDILALKTLKYKSRNYWCLYIVWIEMFDLPKTAAGFVVPL